VGYNRVMRRFKMVASSYLLLIESDKILLSRRYQTEYMDGWYSLPAGHVDEGETVEDCLVREVREEIGVGLKKKDIKLAHVIHRKEHDIRLDFFYICKKYQGKPKNLEPKKCDDLKWFKLDSLPDNILPYINQAIEKHLAGILYSDIGF